MYVYADGNNIVTAMNTNDMQGNTGWMPMPENRTGRTEEELFYGLFEEHGVSLYKVEQGAMVTRTQGEVEADIVPAEKGYNEIEDMREALYSLGVHADG